MADRRSSLTIAVGSGSPRLVMLSKLSGSIDSLRELDLLPHANGDAKLWSESVAAVEAGELTPCDAAGAFEICLLNNFLVGDSEFFCTNLICLGS